MDDLISRQAAIEAIEDVDWYHQNKFTKEMVCGSSSEYESWYKADDIYNAIGCVPSAQQWIPCSERLPHGSCSDLVNVSIHDDSGDTPFDCTSCGWVTPDGEYWIVDGEINNHVIAWMPLPEPWKRANI